MGQLLRVQTVHKGMVSAIVYASSAKLLFSGSIDGNIGVWTDKGFLLQVNTTVYVSCTGFLNRMHAKQVPLTSKCTAL
jgi:hypothetical protein